jgi:hypothetical protein
MDKREYFIRALNEGLYRDKRWVLRMFSLVRENQKEDQVPDWMAYQSTGGFFYKDPEAGRLVQLDEKPNGKPLIDYDEDIFIKKGELPFITEDMTTKYRRVLLHAVMFWYPFGTKEKFTNGQVDLGKFETRIAKNFADDAETQEAELPELYYPRQLELYYEAGSYLRSFAMLFVPAASPKSLSIDPAVLKRRDELLNDPNINIDDQAIAAQVEAELVKMDKDSFKGDLAERFLISKKDFPVIRKKRMIAVGSESGLRDGSKTPYIKASLDDGIDIQRFPDYNNGMRSGSYKRGVETQAGGELFKWLIRQALNIQMPMDDCGTKIGMPDIIDDANKTQFLGYSIIGEKGPIILAEDNIGSYLGKTVLRRSPATCRTGAPDYCATCLGPKLSSNPDALPVAFSQFGNDVMLESMGAMHGKSLEIALFDIVEQAS